MESNWVDFKAVKQSVTMEQILGRYGVKLKKSGKELRGRCPIHQGDGTDSFRSQLGRLQGSQAVSDDGADTRPLRSEAEKERQGTSGAVSNPPGRRYGQLQIAIG